MAKYAKAVVAMLIAGLAVVQTALLDDHITTSEWVMIAAAAAGALGITWAVPNSKAEEK